MQCPVPGKGDGWYSPWRCCPCCENAASYPSSNAHSHTQAAVSGDGSMPTGPKRAAGATREPAVAGAQPRATYDEAIQARLEKNCRDRTTRYAAISHAVTPWGVARVVDDLSLIH